MCLCPQQDAEAFITEINDIGQAYETSQQNNRSLTEQLTARDEAHANLVGERIREGHMAAQMAEARDGAMANNKRLATDLQDHKAHLARVEARLQVCWFSNVMRACLRHAVVCFTNLRALGVPQ